jgi:hypothetical protein
MFIYVHQLLSRAKNSYGAKEYNWIDWHNVGFEDRHNRHRKKATRENWQPRPKILNNLLEHQMNQSERKNMFPKKYV